MEPQQKPSSLGGGPLPAQVDVLVIGSGAAGLSAALRAAASGSEVLLVEASHRWGGATGISGGLAWIPGNHHMAEFGIEDDLWSARAYCTAHAPGRDPVLVDAFLNAAPQMVRFVEQHSPIRFAATRDADSFAESTGGMRGGRHVEPLPVAAGALGDPAELLWPAPYPVVLTNAELADINVMAKGSIPMDLVKRRSAAGEVTLGAALVVGLLRGCVDAGVALRNRCRALRLIIDETGAVSGVTIERDGELRSVATRGGVVLATGGFEWDRELAARHLNPPVTHPVSPPVSRGDGLRMAAEIGAQLVHLDESWCWPTTLAHGDVWPGTEIPRPRLCVRERAMPHVIWVNRYGRRFVDEASHNCALAFAEIDPASNLPRNLPAWAIGDARFRDRYLGRGITRSDSEGAFTEAPTLDALASTIGMNRDGLTATIERYNHFVSLGRDEDFHRGEAAYDRQLGDRSAAHPNLGSIEEAPFVAVQVRPGGVGTKGGPLTNGTAEVLGWDDTSIPGLYAAGNAAAAIIGPGTIAPGLTLGLALTWGFVAGTSAAVRAKSGPQLAAGSAARS